MVANATTVIAVHKANIVIITTIVSAIIPINNLATEFAVNRMNNV